MSDWLAKLNVVMLVLLVIVLLPVFFVLYVFFTIANLFVVHSALIGNVRMQLSYSDADLEIFVRTSDKDKKEGEKRIAILPKRRIRFEGETPTLGAIVSIKKLGKIAAVSNLRQNRAFFSFSPLKVTKEIAKKNRFENFNFTELSVYWDKEELNEKGDLANLVLIPKKEISFNGKEKKCARVTVGELREFVNSLGGQFKYDDLVSAGESMSKILK